MSRLLRAGAPFVLVLALAAGLRFVGAGLASDGARLRPRFDGDGDVLYHAARAQRLASTGDPLWFDPALDPPLGARVLSPPLLEAIIAGAASAATAGAPTDAGVDAASALVPVALGVLAVGAVAALGALLLGPGHGLLAAFGLAISWSAIFYSMVGRSDQHALEQLVFLAVLLAAAWAVDCPRGRGRRPRALLLGLALAVSAWAWQGSALTLLVLSLAAAVDHLLGGAREPEGRRLAAVLAEGGLAGALLLALSIGLLGPPGALRSGAVEGVSALAVATCAGAALGAALLALAARRERPPAWRLAEVLAAGGLAAGAVLAVPALRAGALRGLGPVGRANPWYDVIGEFQPMFLGRTFTPAEDLRFAWLAFGLLPLLAALGAWKVMGGGPHAPARRGQIALLAAAAVALPALWIVRRRFDLYAIVPLVLLAAAAARRLSERALGSRAPRWVPAAAIAVLALAAVPTAPAIADLGTEQDPGMAPVARIAQRLGAAVASGAATPGIIVCSWSRGHHARFFSGLPALVTPFGSDAGPDAMSDWARLMLARTPAEADAVLTSRGARWWLLEPLVVDWALAHRLMPLGAPPVVAGKDGAGWVASPEGAALVSVRLARRDGNAWPGAPALSGYRLVDEDFRLDAPEQAAKLFERVPGAALRVTGAAPADRVLATVALVSPTGRATSLALEATADDGGRASLTLPYATGRNGFVDAGPWSVTSGGVTREVTVAEREVLGGGAVHVALAR